MILYNYIIYILGTLVVTGSSDRSVKVWDIARGYCTHSFKDHTGIYIYIFTYHYMYIYINIIYKKQNNNYIYVNIRIYYIILYYMLQYQYYMIIYN